MPPRLVFAGSRGCERLSLSVVIPAYNEARTVREVVERTCRVASSVAKSYEVIVVDDGSGDGTFEIVSSIAASNPAVVPVRIPVNQGKGNAVKRAAEVSRGDAVVVIDADMEIDPYLLGRYVAALNHCDVCIASKRHPESHYAAPLMRKFLSLGFNKGVRLLTGVAFADSQTGLKAMRGVHFRKILGAITVKRYAYDVEILVVARLLNLRVAEFPVRVVQSARTSSFSRNAIMYMAVDALGIAYRARILRWYQKNLQNPSPDYKPVIPI